MRRIMDAMKADQSATRKAAGGARRFEVGIYSVEGVDPWSSEEIELGDSRIEFLNGLVKTFSTVLRRTRIPGCPRVAMLDLTVFG